MVIFIIFSLALGGAGAISTAWSDAGEVWIAQSQHAHVFKPLRAFSWIYTAFILILWAVCASSFATSNTFGWNEPRTATVATTQSSNGTVVNRGGDSNGKAPLSSDPNSVEKERVLDREQRETTGPVTV